MRYLLIAFMFSACIGPSNRNEGPPISTEILDTVKAGAGKIISTPVLFEAAFLKGTKQTKAGKVFDLYGITIGNLKIVSGRIIACDPLHVDEYGIPFTQTFPVGEYPVQLSIAKLENEEVAAFARIKFSDEPVVRWEFARKEGEEPLPITGNKMHGYSVDYGRVILVDESASKALDRDALTDSETHPLYKEMDLHYHNDWRYAMHTFGAHNLAAVTTGFGDGFYPTYVGFDANGKPCRFLTDFRIFDWKAK